MKINWRQYRASFPRRYLEAGTFDGVLATALAKRKPRRALDIGGGVEGTHALQAAGVETWLLDPFVDKPAWAKDMLTWDKLLVFDFIVARGSINYLTKKQIASIPAYLDKGGIFLANTFATPPTKAWSERPYSNINGQVGVERVRLQRGKVEHELLIGGKKIAHKFFHYPLETWAKLMPGSNWTRYGKNSVLVSLNA